MAEERRGLFRRMFGSREDEATAEGAETSGDEAPAPPPAPATEQAEDLAEPDNVESAQQHAAAPEQPSPPVEPIAAEPEPIPEPPPLPEPAAPIPPPPAPTEQAADERKGWFRRLREGLSRSSNALTGSIGSIFTKRRLDEETLEEFEEALIRADIGVDTAAAITDTLRRERYGKELGEDEVKTILATELQKVLAPVATPLEIDAGHHPHVILVVGVNGTGKTTTIGKLASKLTAEGSKVMLAAGDTFRAAAIDQLKIWGERVGAEIVARDVGADAAGLAFDALAEAKRNGTDVLIVDTAGRLQNKSELMAELEKIIRVLRKQDSDAPHQVLLTLDATTGQNALSQVEIFQKVAGVTGLVMTKLAGTARGGILVAVAARFGLPVHFIGVGESVEDLEPFDASDFARAIAGLA